MITIAVIRDIKESSISNALWDDALSSLRSMPNVEILEPTRSTERLEWKIMECGHAMQDRLGLDGAFWHDTMPYLAFIWSPHAGYALETLMSTYDNLRGDEIIFHTLDNTLVAGWVFGHARAMLHWSLTLPHAIAIGDHWPPIHDAEKTETSRIVWWAQRINLRVYGAT